MPTRDRMATPRDVSSRRNPFELWLTVTCVVTGAAALFSFSEDRNGVIDRYLPAVALLWYFGLLIAGAVTLAGVLWRGRTINGLTRALGCERAGLVMLSGLMLGYGGALLTTAPGVFTGFLLLGLGAASITRVWQVNHELNVIQGMVRDACFPEDKESAD